MPGPRCRLGSACHTHEGRLVDVVEVPCPALVTVLRTLGRFGVTTARRKSCSAALRLLAVIYFSLRRCSALKGPPACRHCSHGRLETVQSRRPFLTFHQVAFALGLDYLLVVVLFNSSLFPCLAIIPPAYKSVVAAPAGKRISSSYEHTPLWPLRAIIIYTCVRPAIRRSSRPVPVPVSLSSLVLGIHSS